MQQDTVTGQATLRRILVARGLIDPLAEWHTLSGGRTNAVWKISRGRNAIVCKLYRDQSANLLFPNSPDEEEAALTALADTGLAPKLLARVDCGLGTCILYRHVTGAAWSGDLGAAAHALRRVHVGVARATGLRSVPATRDAITQHGLAILADTPPAARGGLHEKLPQVPDLPATQPAMLHGDPVPANMVETEAGLTLIDWQCPGSGDPCHDISIFLSPAMHQLYGQGAHTAPAPHAFFACYESPRVATRYTAFAPLLHWRMAAYCAWKASQGARDYAPLVALELAKASE